VWYKTAPVKAQASRSQSETSKPEARATLPSDTDATIWVSLDPPPDPENWTQDPDVLDTWFSAWLWPFATMGWPERTDTLAKFYPTTDLVTAPDIIFFWVARMIMAGFEFMGEMPFRNVYFTGIIRDKQGRKMSKSLGNSPDPLDLIAKYGADALRFGVMRSAPLGQDILFDEKNVELGRNFCTKLWNAARFRQMQDGSAATEFDRALLTSDDRYILLALDAAVVALSRALDDYEFATATAQLYSFFWGNFCDWYLEASKATLNSGDEARKANTLAVIDFVLARTLRLMHPFLPFITEELWQSLGYVAGGSPGDGAATIVFAPWPEPFSAEFRERLGLDEKEGQFAEAKYAVVNAGRSLRRDFNIASNKRARFVLRAGATMPPHESEVIKLLLNAESFEIVDSSWSASKGTPSALTSLGELFLPLEGLVDLAAERQRLTREIGKVDQELAKVRAKLSNEPFVKSAPPSVVEECRERETTWQTRLEHLTRTRDALGG
jgi:valyl-tRNA synthetase